MAVHVPWVVAAQQEVVRGVALSFVAARKLLVPVTAPTKAFE